ncbi:MAG: energy-coupling factor transporter transmembrane component T [Micrococcaceae bacterium]
MVSVKQGMKHHKGTFISNRNPFFKLLVMLILTVPVIFTLNPSIPAVLLIVYFLLMPWWGVPLKQAFKLLTPVFIGAALAGFSTLILGKSSGQVYFTFLWMHITNGSIHLACTIALRVLAIAIPAVILFASTDATELGDALIQQAKLPERFVIGAVAALRMVSLMQEDWAMLQRARRVRGVADGSRIKNFLSQGYVLFVIALRRANKLAASMQVKGFGQYPHRTQARKSIVTSADWLFLFGSIALILFTKSVLKA